MGKICRVFYIVGLVFLYVNCTNSDGFNDSKLSITLLSDSVSMNSGGISSFEFWINSSEIDLSINDSTNYTVGLTNAKGEGIKTSNYRLYSIEKESVSQTGGGRFKLYIEDLLSKCNYNDNVCLTIKHNGILVCQSTLFNISFHKSKIISHLLETGLPLVVVETVNLEEPTFENSITPPGMAGSGIKNATKVPGKLTILKDSIILYYSGAYSKDESGMTIKVRGNSSARRENKKPYKVKLQKKGDLLARNDNKYRDKDWLLLKYDGLKTLIGFKISELIGMKWTPSFQFANVIVNNDYRGLYMLTESVKRNTDCRINVSQTGFLIEYDAYWWNENVYFESKWSDQMNYTFKYPEDDKVTSEQICYIKGYIDSLEYTIRNNGQYENHIDVDSWARWLLSHDILGNGDGAGSNLFYSKYDNTANSKLEMSTIWDLEGIYEMPDDFSRQHIGSIHYFPFLIDNENEIFRNTYVNIWNNVRKYIFNEIDSYMELFSISDIANGIDISISLDNQRWGGNWSQLSEEIKMHRGWFKKRERVLNNLIANI